MSIRLRRDGVPDLEVFEIGADYVLGKWRDELDIEQVLLYGLVKPST